MRSVYECVSSLHQELLVHWCLCPVDLHHWTGPLGGGPLEAGRVHSVWTVSVVPPVLQQALQSLTDGTSFFAAEQELDSNWDSNGGEMSLRSRLSPCNVVYFCRGVNSVFFVYCVYIEYCLIRFYRLLLSSLLPESGSGLGRGQGSGVRVCQ